MINSPHPPTTAKHGFGGRGTTRKFIILVAGVLMAGFLFLGAPPATANDPAYVHLVKPGESLWLISIRYGVTMDAIVRANGLASPNWIYAGQPLVIPRNIQGNRYHTVRSGETVWSISNRYGVGAWALVQQNRITSNLIYVGQILNIPPTSSAAAAPTAVPQRPVTTNPYVKRSTGFDMSYPQCKKALPTPPHTFVIVGINGGRSFIYNDCFESLYDWAAKTSKQTPSIYMNLNYVIGSTADNGLNGPAGRCLEKDITCKAYNYGYNAAKDAFEKAASRIGKVWWIDIEMANTWSSSDAMNGQVIQGAIDYFQNRRVTVGIYSSPDQWTKIVGSFKPRHSNQSILPIWIAMADSHAEAPKLCSSDKAFGGGIPWLVQYPSNGYDGVYVCP